MKISLKVDRNGVPYLLLKSDRCLSPDEQCVEDEVLENFIRNAKEYGIEIVDETTDNYRNDYASIRIKKKNDGER